MPMQTSIHIDSTLCATRSTSHWALDAATSKPLCLRATQRGLRACEQNLRSALRRDMAGRLKPGQEWKVKTFLRRRMSRESSPARRRSAGGSRVLDWRWHRFPAEKARFVSDRCALRHRPARDLGVVVRLSVHRPFARLRAGTLAKLVCAIDLRRESTREPQRTPRAPFAGDCVHRRSSLERRARSLVFFDSSIRLHSGHSARGLRNRKIQKQVFSARRGPKVSTAQTLLY